MVGIKRLIQEARNLEPTSPIEPVSTNPLQPASVPLVATSGIEQASPESVSPLNISESPSEITEANQDMKDTTGENSGNPSQVLEDDSKPTQKEGDRPEQSQSETVVSTEAEMLVVENERTEQTNLKALHETTGSTAETEIDKSPDSSWHRWLFLYDYKFSRKGLAHFVYGLPYLCLLGKNYILLVGMLGIIW